MTRDSMPVLLCDGDDGYCGEQASDFYSMAASKVNGAPVTAAERFPGWLSTEFEDYCPKHHPTES